MNVAVKAVGMFNKLNVPIVGVVENMSYLECPHCNAHLQIFGKGGAQKVSEQFNVPFIGEIPLHAQIMEGSDTGTPVTVHEPNSMQSLAFSKVAKTIAGRISILAAEMREQENKASSQPESSVPSREANVQHNAS
jgi:ATP-binding protein involved in chromosome partitioning